MIKYSKILKISKNMQSLVTRKQVAQFQNPIIEVRLGHLCPFTWNYLNCHYQKVPGKLRQTVA